MTESLNIELRRKGAGRLVSRLWILLILTFYFSPVFAQDGFKSEADLIKGATTYFDQGDYVRAMPLYSQLVSLYPKNPEYNMKYGVSLFYVDPDKSAGLKYLKYAVSKNEADIKVNYYYALVLHANYNFSSAIKYYKKFKEVAKPKDTQELMVDRQIEMCNNGKTLLVNLFELNVVEKKDILKSEFFRIYEISDLGGKIIVKPDQFKSKLDLKNNDFSLIHLPDEARVIYYAGYGDTKDNGKDIFRSRRSSEGEWGPPENIGSVVNTKYDEDFPFMHPDGTLYFASKGHNSMGGYDLFKSVYNESTNTWSAPENLNFPINTPFDDILFISDSKGQLAYFASDRISAQNKITVYRVQISRKPFEAAFLAGNFISENNEGIKSAKISIYDLSDNQKVGTYYTDKEDGSYRIQLPKGGRSYKFVVETDDESPVHTGKVDIPEATGSNSLKQEIRLVGAGDSQKLVIKNLFDPTSRQPVGDEDLMALLKDASSMEVNATVAEVQSNTSGNTSASTGATPSASTPAAGSPGEQYDALLSEANSMIAELGKNTDRLKAQIAFGFKYSLDKANEADKLYEDLEVTRQRMINETDDTKKKALLDELLKQKSVLEPIASDAIVSYDFTASLANEYDELLRDREAMKTELNDFKAGGKPTDQTALTERNAKLEARLKDVKGMNSAFEIAPKRYNDLIQSTNEKLAKQGPYYEDMKRDMNGLQAAITKLENEIVNSKNNKARDQKMAEKGAKEIDLEDLEYQFKDVKKKYTTLKLEKKNLESDSRQLSAFIQKVKNAPASAVQLSSEDQSDLKELINYFKEQRLIDDVIGEEVEVLLAGSDSKKDMSVAQTYAAVDNAGNPLNYDEQYQVNLAGLELIADAVKKNEERSKLYANWSETVGEEQRIQENHLAFTTKSSEKQLIQERIKILDDKKVEYKVKSEEYRVQALALAEVEKPAISPEPVAAAETNQPVKAESKPATAASVPTVPAPKFNSSGNKALGGVVAGVGVITASGKTQEELGTGYKDLQTKAKAEPDKSVAAIKTSAVELNWAASLEQLIDQKELQRSKSSGAETDALKKEIDGLKKEQDQHLKAAGANFTNLEMDRYVKGTGMEEDPELVIPFDPNKRDDDHYEVLFNAKMSAVELDYNLNDKQKSEELAQLHNNWTQTIEEEMLYLAGESSKTTDKGRQKEIATKMKELETSRDYHIERSNYHYEKIREAVLALVEALAATDGAPVQTDLPGGLNASGGSAKSTGPKTVDDLRNEIEASLANTNSSISQKEAALKAAAGNVQKQQLALEIALLNRQKEQEEQAKADLGTAGQAALLNAEAEQALANGVVNWQEEAKDYVFSNKDFSAGIPNSAEATKAYAEAKKLYEEVMRLEAEKKSMLQSTKVDANIGDAVMAKQLAIEEKKVQSYLKLAEATNKEYLENRKTIEALIKSSGKDLKAENPKLARQISSADVIYTEVGKYQTTAANFKSNSLKFDVFDQAQFMGEYVLDEQEKIIESLKSVQPQATGELAFMNKEEPKREEDEFSISQAEHDRIVALPAFVEYEKDKAALVEIQKERKELEARIESENTVLATLVAKRDSINKAAEGLSKSKRAKLLKEAEVLDAQIAAQQQRNDSLSLAMVQLGEREKLTAQNSERLLRSQKPEDRERMILLAEVRSVGAPETAYIKTSPGGTKPVSEPVAVVSAPANQQTTDGGQSTTDPSTSLRTDNGNLAESRDGQLTTANRPTSTVPSTSLRTDDSQPVTGSVAINMEDREFVQKATEIPKELETDLFIRPVSSNNISPYSAAQPIPIDKEIPTGLIFKVQVGAFRNPIPQDLFKGFAPVMGERIPNGITRYTAGLFRDFANANRAKNEIRKMGYSDAFVVAFMDGKRVSFQELQDLPDIDLSVPQSVQAESTPSVPQDVLNKASNIRDRGQVSSAIAEQTNNAREVQGVFFTVQVGVYTNTVLPDKLKGIRELNSELLDNGNIRYSAGQFKSVDDARLRRDQVVGQGIGDAFVTAYNNGVRIGVGEAIKILNGN